jgi:hypothetical protein
MYLDNLNKKLELKVWGNKLIDQTGSVVRLKGVNICSMEWLIVGENMVRSTLVAYDNWGCNVIRVPLNQDFWFGYGPGQYGKGNDYQNVFDRVVQEAVKRDKYIIVDLHWSDQGIWGHKYGQQPMPDENSITFWKSVCSIYGNHPNILFGLYNEPHDVTWEQWKNGGYIEHKASTFLAVGLQQLVEVIRDTGARNICIAGGLDWAYDLTGINNGYALVDKNTAGTFTGNGIVYDTHVYPFKTQWDVYVECIKEQYPILIGECGWFDPQWYRDGIDPAWNAEPHDTWCSKLLDWIEENQLNWTAWSFHIDADPNLLADWNYNPTPEWGSYAKARLRALDNRKGY